MPTASCWGLTRSQNGFVACMVRQRLQVIMSESLAQTGRASGVSPSGAAFFTSGVQSPALIIVRSHLGITPLK